MFLRAILGCDPEQVNEARLPRIERRKLIDFQAIDLDAFEEFRHRNAKSQSDRFNIDEREISLPAFNPSNVRPVELAHNQ